MAESDNMPDNEILAACKDVKERRSAVDSNPPLPAETRRWPLATMAGIGIGSAALAAALIYSNRGGSKGK